MDYQITGFPSACEEYHQNELSLDERLGITDPARRLVPLAVDAPLFNLRKGDLLLVDMARKPAHNSLVYTELRGETGIYRVERLNGKPTLFPSRYSTDEMDDVICGVIVALVRELIPITD
jgi:hypothetical protein